MTASAEESEEKGLHYDLNGTRAALCKCSSTAKVHAQPNTRHGLPRTAWCRERFILTLYSWVFCMIKNRIKITHWDKESSLQWFNNTHFLRKRSRGCSLSSALEANSQLQKGNGILMMQSTCGSFPQELQTLHPAICTFTTLTKMPLSSTDLLIQQAPQTVKSNFQLCRKSSQLCLYNQLVSGGVQLLSLRMSVSTWSAEGELKERFSYSNNGT